jgi:hypothetical protein
VQTDTGKEDLFAESPQRMFNGKPDEEEKSTATTIPFFKIMV